MYESPINQYLIDVQNQLTEQRENAIVQTVTETVGFDIDKEELIKALNYDRNQYKKGYSDGRDDALKLVYKIRDKISYENCLLGRYKGSADSWVEIESNTYKSVLDMIDNMLKEYEPIEHVR